MVKDMKKRECKHKPMGTWIDIIYRDGSHLMVGPKVCKSCGKKL